MLTSTDNTATLPTIVPLRSADVASEELVLTIVFHPDSERVGQRAVVPRAPGSRGWPVGRRTPTFALGEGVSQPLSDAHVSRRALSIVSANGRLGIQRMAGSSRCYIGAGELEDIEFFSAAQLRAGVPILLAHSVVLLLRLGPQLQPDMRSDFGADSLCGNSAAMHLLRRQLSLACASDADVLLLGETGTGKELAAHLLHHNSGRQASPMVAVNVAAIPPELAAAAMFGAARGAYTGAAAQQRGYFERAEGGSLFLDEIGDACTEIQPLLLRALQQREIQQLGGAVRQVDVRVISATDATIDAEDSGFKSALRYRLGACEIRLPPLREHPEDIGQLLLHFLRLNSHEQGDGGLPWHGQAPLLAGWAMIFYRCLQCDWPGNVRQLANVARQLSLSGQAIPQLPRHLRVPSGVAAGDAGVPARRMHEVADDAFAQAMVAGDFEPRRVATLLGVSRSSVYRRIEGSAQYRLAHEVPPAEIHEALARCDGNVRQAAISLGVSGNSLVRRVRVEQPA